LPDRLLAIVLECQHVYRAWSEAIDPELRESLRQFHGACLEELWELLEPHLLGIARGWRRSDVGQDNDLQSLAFGLFYHIVDALPQLRIKPERNLLNYLLTIARYGIYDENRIVYRRTPGPRTLPPRQDAASGTREAAMWRENTLPQTPDLISLKDIADPQSVEQDDKVIEVIYKQECWPHIRTFWSTKLSLDDQKIIQMRIGKKPPLEFEDIAKECGPGWTAAAVRQRYHRSIKKIHQYLLKQGLLDGME
jgi:hypothetical protein